MDPHDQSTKKTKPQIILEFLQSLPSMKVPFILVCLIVALQGIAAQEVSDARVSVDVPISSIAPDVKPGNAITWSRPPRCRGEYCWTWEDKPFLMDCVMRDQHTSTCLTKPAALSELEFEGIFCDGAGCGLVYHIKHSTIHSVMDFVTNTVNFVAVTGMIRVLVDSQVNYGVASVVWYFGLKWFKLL